ncbi:MAG TPA: HutD family protein, partial [Roseateles sp.]|nr:HutD family protein [Roseateles sp.]
MSWSKVSAADVQPQAWKNQGGTTRELLAWPHAHDWALRVSVARVDRNGPFSAFP